MSKIAVFSVPSTSSYVGEGVTSESLSFGHSELVSHKEATLGIELEGRIHFTYPKTWTYDEMRETLQHFLPRLARARCLTLVHSLPDEVMPAVLPQFQEIAEHEIRMWQVRSEIKGPDIRERRRTLPTSK